MYTKWELVCTRKSFVAGWIKGDVLAFDWGLAGYRHFRSGRSYAKTCCYSLDPSIQASQIPTTGSTNSALTSLFSLVFNHIAFPSSIQATGGSGNYSWSSTSTDVAAVTSLGQVVTSSSKGETTMRATDTRNAAHFDTAQVAVLPPAKMAFLPSRVEAEVDSSLELPLAVYTKRGAVRSRNHTEW